MIFPLKAVLYMNKNDNADNPRVAISPDKSSTSPQSQSVTAEPTSLANQSVVSATSNLPTRHPERVPFSDLPARHPEIMMDARLDHLPNRHPERVTQGAEPDNIQEQQQNRKD